MNNEPVYLLSQVVGDQDDKVLTSWYENFERILLEHKVITKASSSFKLERVPATIGRYLCQTGHFNGITMRRIKAIGTGSIFEEKAENSEYSYSFTFAGVWNVSIVNRLIATNAVREWLLFNADCQTFGTTNMAVAIGVVGMKRVPWLINTEQQQLAVTVDFTCLL